MSIRTFTILSGQFEDFTIQSKTIADGLFLGDWRKYDKTQTSQRIRAKAAN